MPKGVPNKRYTPKFKQKVVEAVMKEGLSYQEAAKLYEVNGQDRIQSWERIYLRLSQKLMKYLQIRARCKTAGKKQRGLEPKRVSKPRCLL